jgi:hypothetical protein
MAAARPATWAEVLELAGFNANVRTVLIDVNRENSELSGRPMSQPDSSVMSRCEPWKT